MTRRQIIAQLLCLGLLPLASRRARADGPSIPFVAWVERFYRTQLAKRERDEGRGTPENDALIEPTLAHPLRDYLSREMQALYDDAATRQMPPEEAAEIADGPILHEIFGWGALPNRDIKLVGVTRAPWWQGLVTKDLALVTLNINGNERELTLAGEYDAETFNWKIADIDYGDGADETLRDRLERMGTWPKRG